MKLDDILYISENLSSLTGIPVRVYENEELIKIFSTVDLVKDPFILYIGSLRQSTGNIAYFSTKDFFFYAIIKHVDHYIIIGPFWPTKPKRQVYMDLAFELDIKKDDLSRFINSMSSITNMPLETVLQSLITYNFVLNNEKIRLNELLKTNAIQTNFDHFKENTKEMRQIRNSTLLIEETIQSFVQNGDLMGFDKWVESAPAIHAGSISNDFLRQQKNTFIVTATLSSRSAIKGGMDYTDAMDLTDSYILRSEASNSYNEISSLSYDMIRKLILNVSRIKLESSPLKSKISSYVYSHISEPVNLSKIANHLYMSKSNLCLKFKEETGMTVLSYIQEKKIEEGKRLIALNDKPISSIALYLGFSSQAHFSKVFKEITGTTPASFKNKNDLF